MTNGVHDEMHSCYFTAYLSWHLLSISWAFGSLSQCIITGIIELFDNFCCFSTCCVHLLVYPGHSLHLFSLTILSFDPVPCVCSCNVASEWKVRHH